ncbi:cytochrome P450 [Actinophytocola sp.]|jgi:cytochrome P450|uniref:cytochrome P450 family protein n=1 Tax=Actinophytocola sp. TaxID=1872138 RepID=UPI002EDAF32F
MTDEPKLLDLLFDQEAYGRLRDQGITRVRHFNGTPTWVVSRYDDVMAVVNHPGVSNSPRYQNRLDTVAAPGIPAEYVRYLGKSVSMMDAPQHTAVRRQVSKVFTARRVQALRPRVQQITDELLDGLAPLGEVDLLERFAYPLPFDVISELLGVPREFRGPWREALEGMMWGTREQVAPGAQAMLDYATRLVRLRREEPGEDLLSALANTDDEDRLDDDALISMVITILNAGHETSAQLIANGMYALITHPGQLAALRANPALLPSAVEEMLRFTGPAELSALRFTKEDIEVGGVSIPAGEVIQIIWAAANKDGGQFAGPAGFDITRKNNAHFGFGHGIHYCLGAPLARIEGQVAFGTILRRFPDLAFSVPEAEVTWRRGFPRGINRLDALPVRLGAEADTGTDSSRTAA